MRSGEFHAKKATLLLMILDGWGYNENNKHNAIAQANTPQWDEWWKNCPHILLQASGFAVGLPDAQMGNSEVGHMHIGAGRVIQQDFTRINESINHGEFAHNPVFHDVINTLQKTGKSLHIMGLFSPGESTVMSIIYSPCLTYVHSKNLLRCICIYF